MNAILERCRSTEGNPGWSPVGGLYLSRILRTRVDANVCVCRDPSVRRRRCKYRSTPQLRIKMRGRRRRRQSARL
eukprot:3152227-Pyramimonas_sp.AAC.1